MRLWTIHPRYLDPQGLVALWRESLLARAVLLGRTKGYRHHPQLQRFQEHSSPDLAINAYLASVLDEAVTRGYDFDKSKVGTVSERITIRATSGQLAYEWRHLLDKLKTRSPERFKILRIENPEPHPLFRVVAGPIASWERPKR